MRKKLLFIIALLFQLQIYAQVEDAWVYFNDKENVTQAISNPISILTQQAIDRKAAHGIPIDFRDVPVNESYITQLKNAAGISVWAKSKWFNAVHVRGTQSDIDALLNLSFVDQIEYANGDLNTSRRPGPTANKFEIESTRINFNYGNTQNQVEMLNLHLLHQSDYTGDGIVIAVLDSGFPGVNTISAFQRLRDAGDLLDGYDFVDRDPDVYAFASNDHGTRVLSTMAAYVEDQFVGTAPDASYYLFRTEDVFSENPVEESYWVEAAERADSLGVDIINTSLGYKSYDDPDYTYSSADMNGQTAFISRGAGIASEKGMLLVNSAGNSGASGVNAPADSPDVFSIGAVDQNGMYASFSSQGNTFQPSHKPDVMARGASSSIINSGGGISQNNGTSFSSPILAGGVACLMQAVPDLNASEIKQIIRESSSQYNFPDYLMGYGIPDFDLALNNALSLIDSVEVDLRIYPNPVVDRLNFIFPPDTESVQVYIFDALGKVIIDETIQAESPSINLSSLSSGIYLSRMESGQESKIFKLIKE
ncbi:MAG: S8 family serine peptidase [Flavobacteriaceae bacterium]|nr:S8 family serine peptidase [Flavobacteriaceae bacterium]